MDLKKIYLLSLIGGVIGMICIAPAGESQLWAQEKEKKGKEALLFQEIPVVITASRKEQPITEAPTTITVITAEDIRYSGATTIPDVLRMAAGVDVMTITVRDQHVGVRGFITRLSNKLLVLINGRSVYTDLYGLVLWEIFPVGLAEIDRIEVVKSPASSLYGANAYSGVINIITKSPEQLEGTTLHLTGGTRNTFIGSLLHAGTAARNKIRYTVALEWDKTDEWGEDQQEEKAPEILRANALLEYRPGEKSKLVLSGGRGHSKDGKLLAPEYVGTGNMNAKSDYFQFDFEYSTLKFRTFFKREKADVVWLWNGEQQSWENTVYNAELLHSFQPGKAHSLVWGLNYRYNRIKPNAFIPQDQRQHLWALFLEDEIKISEQLHLTLGGRYDHHPLVGGRFSPRGNIYFSPSKKHIFRFSVSRAFRDPSFVDSYLYAENQIQITLTPPLPPINIPYTVTIRGNRDLKPEGITAYEIGYLLTSAHRLKLNVNLFYNQYSDFFTSSAAFEFYAAGEIFPGSPGGVFPKQVTRTFQNGGSAWGIGGEVNLDVFINQWLSGFVNYSFQQITDKEDDPVTPTVNEENRIRTDYPKHKLNAGLRALFKNGISVNLLVHWVAKTERLLSGSSGEPFLAPVDDYFILNARVGYSFRNEKTELAFSVFNFLNHKHFEHPPGQNSLIPNSYCVGRRITFTIRYKL